VKGLQPSYPKGVGGGKAERSGIRKVPGAPQRGIRVGKNYPHLRFGEISA